jgi:glycosyltransferase involved in cell wall biosynthesis
VTPAESSSLAPRVLLISGTPPGPQGVGGIILRDLCRFYPTDRLSAFVVSREPNGVCWPDELAHISVASAATRFEHSRGSRFGKPGRALAGLLTARAFRSHISDLTDKAAAFGRTQKVDAVWCVLDGPTSIALAARVADALEVPLFTLVWDDARHLVRSLQLDRLTASRLLHDAAAAITKSRRCAVISEAMKEHYELAFGTECVVLRHGMPMAKVRRTEPTAEGEFRIGFAGTMSAPEEFRSLLEALRKVHWQISGKKIAITVIGRRIDVRAETPVDVAFLGWRSVDETIDLLSRCDVCYLPQPFSPTWLEFTTLSFPTKFTTYLAAGRPIFLHAPANGSLVPYQRREPFAVWCRSLDPDAIIAALTRITTDRVEYLRLMANGRRLLEAEFTEENFVSAFARFLGVARTALRASAAGSEAVGRGAEAVN